MEATREYWMEEVLRVGNLLLARPELTAEHEAIARTIARLTTQPTIPELAQMLRKLWKLAYTLEKDWWKA